MTRLVSIEVDDDLSAPTGHHRLTITLDIPADTAFDAVGWAIDALGKEA